MLQHVYNNNNSDNSDNSDNSEKEDNAEMSSAPDGSGKDYEERGTLRVTAKAPGNGEEKTTSPQDIVSEFEKKVQASLREAVLHHSGERSTVSSYHY